MIASEEFNVFDELEKVDDLEEGDDIAALDAAMAEGGDNIPWDEALEQLGWV